MGPTENRRSGHLHAVILTFGLVISAALVLALVIGLSGDPAVAKKDKKVAQQEKSASQDFDPQRDYDQSLASDELRAYHGKIFVARVDALEGENEEPSGGTAPPLHVQNYVATVERTLVGDASGQVRIVYWGAYDETPDTMGFGPLRIGERYLFFAGDTENGTGYTVQAGSGTILITSEQQEQELVDHYLPLIAEAEVHAQEVNARATAWAEANAARAATTPSVLIDPEQGPPGTQIIVRGENFGFMEATITFGEERTFADVAVEDGSFRAKITIPQNAQSGVFPIAVDDQRDFATEVAFTVTE